MPYYGEMTQADKAANADDEKGKGESGNGDLENGESRPSGFVTRVSQKRVRFLSLCQPWSIFTLNFGRKVYLIT